MGAIAGEALDADCGGVRQSQPPSQPRQQASTTGAIASDQFLVWKRRKDAEAAARLEEVSRKRAEDVTAGRVRMNGRELFLHEPWVFDDSRYV